jgi:nucleoside-diphosphate kinase
MNEIMDHKNIEQTLVLIKPDALKNSLTGYVLSQLSEFHTGLRYAGAKIVQVSKILAEQHYAEHQGKIFFPFIIDYIMGKAHYPNEAWKRRVKAFVYQGPEAVKKVRYICGPTDPHEAREKSPGCIRALGTLVQLTDKNGKIIGQRMDNLIHASANVQDAEREIKLWFKPCDIPPGMHIFPTDVAKEHIYYRNGKLYDSYCEGSTCLFAPGDIVWKSDLEAVISYQKEKKSKTPIEAVAAKYMINLPNDDL